MPTLTITEPRSELLITAIMTLSDHLVEITRQVEMIDHESDYPARLDRMRDALSEIHGELLLIREVHGWLPGSGE